MSVVNKMLRDLDRRQIDPSQPIFTQHVGMPAAQSKGPIVLACVIAAAVTAGVIFFLQKPGNESAAATSAAIEAATAAPQSAPQPTPVIVTEAPPPVAVVTEKPPEPSVASTAPTQLVEIVPPLRQTAAERPIERPKRIVEPPAPAVVAVVPVEAVVPAVPAPAVDNRPARIDLRPSALSAQSADGEYRRAIVLINQARAAEARAALATALKLDARHESARQTLAVLLLEDGQAEAAEALLTEGLRILPAQSNFAMVLARLKVERGDNAGALKILRQYGPIATGNAQYRGFAAALLQRAGLHTEAIEEYRAALALVPANGVWWMGLGLSYEANEQKREAADAYTRARAAGLTADLAEFVDRKLQTLR